MLVIAREGTTSTFSPSVTTRGCSADALTSNPLLRNLDSSFCYCSGKESAVNVLVLDWIPPRVSVNLSRYHVFLSFEL